MKRFLLSLSIILIFVFLFFAARFYYQNLRGAGPAFGPIPTVPLPIVQTTPPTPGAAVNTTGLPLSVPDGFSISTYAKNIPDARVLAWDPAGHLLISSPATGKVFSVSESGTVSEIIHGLNQPHGLAFRSGTLYIAETNAVAIYDYNGVASNRRKIIDLPGGGNHFSRTIAFGPDGKLYIAIGSTCNACIESNPFRAKILTANADGSDIKIFASGLRNAVFFTWNGPEMWATVMGRDYLGDNLPPDTIDIIKNGKNYGWPYCFGKQVWDKTFDGSTKAEDFCKTTEPSFIDYQAHSAPLGLAFTPKTWPAAYQNNLIVAMHGSWNRTVPTGYKLVRFKFDNTGKYLGNEDFISGWVTPAGALGRPVDVLFDDKGNLFISDDKAGVVYKVSRM